MAIDELRGLSSAVFGHRYRLELLAALAKTNSDSDEGICLTLLGNYCGVPSSVYYPSLKVLVSAGLARRMSRTHGDPRVLYARTHVPVWTGLQRMVEDLEVEVSFPDVAHVRRNAER